MTYADRRGGALAATREARGGERDHAQVAERMVPAEEEPVAQRVRTREDGAGQRRAVIPQKRFTKA